MAFTYLGRMIDQVGVIGSGQIGPDIALYFSKVLSPFGVRVAVVDISEDALEKGRARLDKKVDRGIQSGAFTPEQGETMKQAVTFTTDYGSLAGAAFVVEAATEDEGIKRKIFKTLEDTCAEDAILASNSSHLEPEVIARDMRNKARACVIHYFFPAERNPIVEIVPGAETDPDLAEWLLRFYERLGKVPVKVKSRYGYAIDPVFEGIFHAAALALEEGLGTSREIDFVAARALGQTIGPFTAMNLTGGNPITAKGLDNYHQKIMPWYRTTKMLAEKAARGEAWDVPARGEVVAVDPEKERVLTELMQGAYLGIVDEILTAELLPLSDLEMAIEIALDMTPPVALIRKLGIERAAELAETYARNHEGFKPPVWLPRLKAEGRIPEVAVVHRRDVNGVAVLKIRRPKVLNALNEETFAQIRSRLAEVRDDAGIKAAVLTGFGVKAFVSGADVNFLARIDSPETGMRGSREAQELTLFIEDLGKPVICAFNGVAFGGGLEIAMACTARVTRRKLKVLAGQPEVNLGIIPGAGGTQRLPRLVGIEKGAGMLRTGRPVSSSEAVEIGLCLEEVDLEHLVDRAVEIASQVAEGRLKVPEMPKGPLPDVPEQLPEIDIGHLSRAVDAILCRAILEGARLTLREGLELENRLFGEVCKTQDMKIGIKNFLENGPRSKAPFVHA